MVGKPWPPIGSERIGTKVGRVMERLGSALVWFRNDLRLVDNPAFCEAVRYVSVARRHNPDARLYALLVLAPFEMRCLQHWGLAKADYHLRSARVLEANLAQRDISLLVHHEATDTFAQPEAYYRRLGEAIIKLCRAEQIEAVYMNAEYDGVALDRDAAISEQLDAAGIVHHTSHDQCVVLPGKVATQAGTPFKIFSQFKKSWAAWIEQHGLEVTPSPPPEKQQAAETISSSQLEAFALPPGFSRQEWPELDLEQVRRVFPAGEQAAMAQLEAFLDGPVLNYQEDRNHFMSSGASRMSAPLAVGAISLRQCLIAARARNKGHLLTGQPGLVHWISELCWRDFYRHVFVSFSHVAHGHSFRPEYEHLGWRGWPVKEGTTANQLRSEDAEAEQDFARWAEGRTGVPIVDAAMRQLRQEAWQSNRLRMVVAMYLTKDLLIHWRRGERHFQEHLIDYDPASNNGGWQWSASTGTDAQPYFRIFNPLLQSEKFDPPGDYIRKYVAELAKVKAPAVHAPGERLPKDSFAKLIGDKYPARPMVEHGQAKERVLAMFKKATTAAAESAKRALPPG